MVASVDFVGSFQLAVDRQIIRLLDPYPTVMTIRECRLEQNH